MEGQKKIVRPEHLNQHGRLFGGYMLLWVDEYAYLAALEDYPGCHFVTRGMAAVSFTRGVNCGDILSFSTRRERVGESSVTYRVEVTAAAVTARESVPVFSTSVTMCAVGVNDQKIPLPKEG